MRGVPARRRSAGLFREPDKVLRRHQERRSRSPTALDEREYKADGTSRDRPSQLHKRQHERPTGHHERATGGGRIVREPRHRDIIAYTLTLAPAGAAGTDPDNFSSRDWLRTLHRSKLQRIRFHDLRHTYASLLIAQGAYPKYIQN